MRLESYTLRNTFLLADQLTGHAFNRIKLSTTMWSAGELPQRISALWDGGLKQTSGGLDAKLTSVSDEAQAIVVGIFHFSHPSEVGSRHGCGL
jgi:hypothetical protein